MRVHDITICRAVILVGVILLCILCIQPCSADGNQLQVTVTASPVSVSAGSSAQVMVTAAYLGQPVSGATVAVTANTGSARLSPSSGLTDSSGKAAFRLDTTTGTGGTVRVSATVTKQSIDLGTLSGNGYADVTVQPMVLVPVEGRIVVTTTTPVPYQPPAPQPQPQPYQPVPQPAPYQPPTKGQPGINKPPVAVISIDRYAGDVPLTVTFDGRKSYAPGGSIVTYSWDFGDGRTGSGYIIQHTYTKAGTYPASLVVTDNNGCSSVPATTQISGGSAVQAPVYRAGGPCDDANKCTVNDYYDASGKYVAGQQLNCDDNNPDTLDICDPAKGCVHSVIKTGQGGTAAEQAPVPPFFGKPLIYPDIPGYIFPGQTRQNEVRALPGSVVQIPVMILNADQIGSIKLPEFRCFPGMQLKMSDLNKRVDILRLDHWTKGSLTQNAIITTDAKPEEYVIPTADTTQRYSLFYDKITTMIIDPKGISGKGTLVVYYFKAVGNLGDESFCGPINFEDISFTAIKTDGSPVNIQNDLFFLMRLAGEHGDCCENGGISSEDVLCAENMVLGNTPVSPSKLWACDMNGDNAVTEIDALEIAKLAAYRSLYNPFLKMTPVNAKKCSATDCLKNIYHLSGFEDPGLNMIRAGPDLAHVKACPGTESFCNGNCIDLQTDSNNCGACGHSCSGAERCCLGRCESGGVAC